MIAAAPTDGPATTIALSLVSHTNAGKTSLARTLLGRDVGVVRDAPHVTDAADVFTMLETPGGDRLLLWDTPGFGDSQRLVDRLRAASNPVGWFLGQVWDRWHDRPFWAAQRALRNLREQADAMLYLVNAAEAPEAAGYLDAEMALLGWLDKPVVVLMNQLGPARDPAAEAEEAAGWRSRLAGHAVVREVLPLDAFARCWVQEGSLLEAVERLLADPAQRLAMVRLRAAWWTARVATFDAAAAELAGGLARIAADIEPFGAAGATRDRIAEAGGRLGRRLQRGLAEAVGRVADRVAGRGMSLGGAPAASEDDTSPLARAEARLLGRLEREVRAGTAALLALHGLEGRPEGEALVRGAADVEARRAVDEGRAALWGGAVSGALAGLKADLLSGGLTLGGGLVAGGVLGALGGAGLARGVNLVRGTQGSSIAWSDAALDRLFEAALLRYLAVAHVGRGRGGWAPGEAPPPHWRDAVERAVAPRRAALAAVWRLRAGATDAGDAPAGLAEPVAKARLSAALEPIFAAAAAAALHALYPETPPLRESVRAAGRASA